MTEETIKLNRDALIAKLYTSRQMFESFDTEIMKAENSVELAFKLGQWQSSMLSVIRNLLEDLENYDK